MKTTYKNLRHGFLTLAVCVFCTMSVNAQHPNSPSGGGGNGGGGGSHPSSGGGGGGGTAVSHPASNSGSSVSHPASNGGSSVSRPSGNSPRVGATVQRQPNNVNRQGGVGARNSYGNPPAPNVVVRGNYGYSHRTTVVPVGAAGYRTVPVVGAGRTGFWGNHNYYYKNYGYYKSYYLPRLGYRCNVLPYGYYPFYYGDYQYFYSEGLFYEYENDVYTVVEPPVGAEVTSLPDNAQSIVINGVQYYEANGVYYQPYTKDDGTQVYVVSGKDGELNTNSTVQDNQPPAPQIGDIVNQLPDNCRKINVNGQKLYVSPDGIYYQQQVDINGNITYKIVGLPSNEPDQN